MEINYVSIYYQWTICKVSKESNPIHNSIKKNKILGNKFNQGNERSVFWKIQDSVEKKLKTQRKGKIFHACGLKELISLKCTYYLK